MKQFNHKPHEIKSHTINNVQSCWTHILGSDNDNDNDNILFDHNLQIEVTIYNSLENQIINTLVWRLLLRQNNNMNLVG